MSLIKLLQKNKEKEPKTYDAIYGSMVENELKKEGYSTSKIQAIINNFLSEPDNEQYSLEFWDLQKCRKECKERIKNQLK